MRVRNKIFLLKMKSKPEWPVAKEDGEMIVWKPHTAKLSNFADLERAPEITKSLLKKVKEREEKKSRGPRHQLRSKRFFVLAGRTTHKVDYVEILDYKKCLVKIHWPPFFKPPVDNVQNQLVAQLERESAQKDVRIGVLENALAKSEFNGSKKSEVILEAFRDVEDLGGKLRTEKKEKEELKGKLQRVEEEKEGLIHRAEDLERQVQQTIGERDSALDRVRELTDQLEVQTRSEQQARNNYDAASRRAEGLERELAEAKEKLEELGRSKDVAVVQAKEAEVAKLSARLDKEIFAMANLRREKKQLEEKLVQTQTELGEQIQQTHTELKASQTFANSLQKEVDRLREPEDNEMFLGFAGL